MKYSNFLYLFLSVLFFNTSSLFAHALLIETNANGKVGTAQEVNIFYSEFEDRSLESVADWYSNVADFELWLVKPNGEKMQLSTQAGKKAFTSSFTPDAPGKYRLEISHMAADPGEGTAYQFNAFAEVNVGKSDHKATVSATSPDLVLIHDNMKKGMSHFKTYFKNKPKEDVSLKVFYPSGKTKEFKSNAEGHITVELSEKGDYLFEATTYHSDEKGETSKAPYASVWRVATQKISVK